MLTRVFLLLLFGACAWGQGFTTTDQPFLAAAAAQFVQGTNLTNGLIGWWKFDECSGNTSTADSSGSGFTGTIGTSGGMPWGSENSIFYQSGCQVTINNNNYVNMGSHASLQTSPFTWSIWVYPTNFVTGFIISGDAVSFAPTIDIVCDHGTNSIDMEDMQVFFARSTSAIGTNVWTWIVLTYDNPTVKIYANAVQIGSGSHAPTWPTSSVLVGRNAYGNYYYGRVDDFRIYSHALTTNEINYLYHQWYGKP